MTTKTRYANIDLLRSIAILMVVFYHSVNMSKVPQWFWDIGETGALGVDLFFVLSGFLVGGLYFKERREFGTVSIPHFICRRIFRTIPMYFLIMPLAYLATYSARNIPFDWSYLLFLQNYRYYMPFYVISWSLCIEEHFYLIMPFVLPFLLNKNTTNTEGWLDEANNIMQSEISPISDVRGSADYKRLLARQLFKAHFQAFSSVLP